MNSDFLNYFKKWLCNIQMKLKKKSPSSKQILQKDDQNNSISIFESVSKEISGFLKIIPLKQQKMYSLIHLNYSCMDYIQRFVPSIDVTNLYPQIRISNYDEEYYNKELYKYVRRTFLHDLHMIFIHLSESKKNQYKIFIHNEIIFIKNLVSQWKDSSKMKNGNSSEYNIENEEKVEIQRRFTIPTLDKITQVINESFQFLFLFRSVYRSITDFLDSLYYNQQAYYSLMYLIHFVDKFLSQSKLSINIDSHINSTIQLYEENYDEDLYSITYQSFLDNLALVYDKVSKYHQSDPMKSLMSLNSFIEIQIIKVKQLTKDWDYFHIMFPDWDIKELYQ